MAVCLNARASQTRQSNAPVKRAKQNVSRRPTIKIAANRSVWGVAKAPSVLGSMVVMLILLLSGCLGESQAEKLNSSGVFLETQKRLEDAVAEFDQAIRLEPQFALAYYNRGQANLKLEKYESAIEDYGQAIEFHPDPALIYIRRGEAYYALGQIEQANQDYTEAIRRDPENAMAYYNRGGSYFELGQRDLAIQDYEKAVALDLRLTEEFGYKCQLFDDLDGYQPSVKDCKFLIRVGRQFAGAFSGRGSEFYELGQYRRAIRDYDRAIRLDSTAKDYNNRALAHLKVDNIDDAFDDFERAAGGPDYADPYFNRGGLYFDLGEYRFAIDDYSQGIRRDPTDAGGYAKRALAYIALGKDDEAELDIGRAVDLGFGRVELEEAVQELKNRR